MESKIKKTEKNDEKFSTLDLFEELQDSSLLDLMNGIADYGIEFAQAHRAKPVNQLKRNLALKRLQTYMAAHIEFKNGNTSHAKRLLGLSSC